jgi:hypothetical protein
MLILIRLAWFRFGTAAFVQEPRDARITLFSIKTLVAKIIYFKFKMNFWTGKKGQSTRQVIVFKCQRLTSAKKN